MITGNEYYLSTPGLLVPRSADSRKLENCIQLYIDRIQGQTENLTNAFSEKRVQAFAAHLHEIHTMLERIYARWLETDAETLQRALSAGDLSYLTRMLEPFVSNLLMLSIDLQMAQIDATRANDFAKSKIENYMAIINHMQTVEKLVEADEIKRGVNMLLSIDGLKGISKIDDLLSYMKSRDTEKIKLVISQIVTLYTDRIVDMGGSRNDLLKKVLAVDDRPEILTALSDTLRPYCRTLAATSGRMALKILEKQVPELFILDIDMPHMDGFELAARIRQNPFFSKTPLIYLTGNSAKEYVLRAIQSGASDFIVKPAGKDALVSKVARYLRIGI